MILACLVCTFNSKAANANAVNFNAESTGSEQQQLVVYDQHYQQQLTQLFSSLNTMTGVAGFSVAVIHKGELVASVATAFADWLNGLGRGSSVLFHTVFGRLFPILASAI